MPISVACRSCHGKFKSPDGAAGSTVKCPKCSATITVPDSDNPVAGLTPPKVKRPSPRAAAGDEDDGPEEKGRPRHTGLYLAIGGGVVATLLLTGVLILLLRRGPAEDAPGPVDRVVARENVPPDNRGAAPEPAAYPTEKSDPKIIPSPPASGEVIRQTADQLTLAFEQDENGTNGRYRGKVIDLTGVVKSVGKDVVAEPGKVLACLSVGGARATSVGCTLTVTKTVGDANLLLGKTVKVRGTYTDVLAPALVGCPVLSSTDPTDSPTSELQAEARRKERDRLLIDLREKSQAALTPLEEEYRTNAAAFEKLKADEAALRQNPRFGDPFNTQVMGQFNALVKTQRDLARKIQETQAKIDAKGTEFEQDRRKILVRYPLPDDPRFVEYKGLLLTVKEVAERKDFEREHGSPRTAAETFMKAAEARGTISRPVYGGTFADPQQKAVAVVAFTVRVNARSQAVYLFVYQKDTFWFVSNLPGGADNNVFLGPPPTGFKRLPDGSNADGKKPEGPKGPFDQ